MTSNPNKLPLHAMSEDEAVEIFKAWWRGEGLEEYILGFDGGSWKYIKFKSFDAKGAYRIPPRQDTVPWPHVANNFIAYARSENGQAAFFERVPYICEGNSFGFWWVEGSHIISADCFANWKPGTVDWKHSLQRRPK